MFKVGIVHCIIHCFLFYAKGKFYYLLAQVLISTRGSKITTEGQNFCSYNIGFRESYQGPSLSAKPKTIKEMIADDGLHVHVFVILEKDIITMLGHLQNIFILSVVNNLACMQRNNITRL